MNALEKLFNKKITENGDISYKSTGNYLLDLLFMSSYYEKHLDEVGSKIPMEVSNKDKLFAMFMRDPRFGLGRRDLGRELMYHTGVSPSDMAFAGRFDDLWHRGTDLDLMYLYCEITEGNELAKKWMPRYSSKDKAAAKAIASIWKMTKQEYGKFIKANTVERKLTEKRTEEINFEHVPSLAMIKYYNRFLNGDDTGMRFRDYLDNAKKGTSKLNVSTTNVYDIFKNRNKIDADLFFDKLEKIIINCIPILDTSGSMQDENDSLGKAMSIAHYLAKCSTYCNNQVISFSSRPQLMTISEIGGRNIYGKESKYCRELNSMYTGDCSNTDFGKVMDLLSDLDEYPEYLVVLSDMEFDVGSSQSKDKTMKIFREHGANTKIVWWNFNSRNTTCPEMDNYGNIYISGYNPMLLKYLEAGFDGEKFLDKLLDEYAKNMR